MRNYGVILLLLIIYISQNIYSQDIDTLALNSNILKAKLSIKDGEYSKSRDYAREALKIDPGFGEAYIIIGVAYVSSIEICKDEPVPNMIYCLAVDMFEKALEVDSTMNIKAKKFIEVYSNYFPNRETTWHLPREGDKYKIGCWINEETTVRYSD